jgi:hypothetical protein
MRLDAAIALGLFACGGAARQPLPAEQIVLAPRAPASEPPPPARAEVTLGQIIVDAGFDSPTPDAELRGQVVSWANGSRGCWYARGGRFEVEFVVGIRGNVFDARVESADAAAADCAKNRLIGWRFPEAQTMTHVTATVVARALSPPASDRPPFDRGAAAAALGAVDLRGCAAPGGPTGGGHVSVTFEPSGNVADASVDQPPFAGTGVGACVERQFRAARVAPYDGGQVKVGKSFVIP